MAAISALITEMRTDLSDDSSTRFSDTQLLSLLKKAIRRANRIVQRHGIQFAKKKIILTASANQDYVEIYADAGHTVADFDVWIGLFRDTLHEEIPKQTETEWETIIAAPAMATCFLDQAANKIYFNGTPTAGETLTLWYYPTIDPAYYTVSTSTPWGGRLDDVLMEYACLRAKNIDEMNAAFDQALMADMENQILGAYQPNSVLVTEGKGWL
jgi:hypothetical protein